MKITCLIIDDEPNAVSLLEEYAARIQFLELKGKYYDAFDALEVLKEKSVDLIFLDINLPGISGIEFKDMIAARQKVIFTTAYSQYAVESYDKEVVDYLLKPITFKRFLKSVMKVAEKIKSESYPPASNKTDEDYLFVKTGREINRLQVSDILLIEGQREYVSIQTTSQKILTFKRMKEMEEVLPSCFIRIHNSFIVNYKRIDKISENHVFISGKRIPIGKKYHDLFLQKISEKSI